MTVWPAPSSGRSSELIVCVAPSSTTTFEIRLGSFDQIRGIIDEELEAIWSGDKSAQEAMDSAKERGDALLRRFEQANR